MNGTLDGVASQFSLSARAIATAGAGCATWLNPRVGGQRIVERACRSVSRSRLDDLAQRLDPVAGWNDLALPEAAADVAADCGACEAPADGVPAVGLCREGHARPRDQRPSPVKAARQDHGGGSVGE